LEGVAVEMERVFAGIVIVQHDFDDFVFGENELARVGAVDGGVCGVGACGEGRVERGHFGADVGYVVEEGTEG
jgi:hypothetical protein